jgi:pimeloyl-ACP methyl ester carboxylesterase
MLIESIICSLTPSYPYHIAAKRYSVHRDRDTVKRLYDGHDKGPTLVFLHSTSFPKEMWEPTIEGLLRGDSRRGTRIREAYAIDYPNHGEVAVLNDGLLGSDCAGMVESSISPCWPSL